MDWIIIGGVILAILWILDHFASEDENDSAKNSLKRAQACCDSETKKLLQKRAALKAKAELFKEVEALQMKLAENPDMLRFFEMLDNQDVTLIDAIRPVKRLEPTPSAKIKVEVVRDPITAEHITAVNGEKNSIESPRYGQAA